MPAHRPRRPMVLAVATLLLCGAGRGELRAQARAGSSGAEPARAAGRDFRASPYLPLDHWAYDVLDRWLAAGRLEGLSPLTRPWRRRDVARALLRLDADRLDAAGRGWLERLRDELGHELLRLSGGGREGPWIGGRLEAGGRWRSQAHRDQLRPVLEGRFSDPTVQERIALAADGVAGPVAGAFRFARDGQLTEDPQFPDGRVVPDKDLDLVGIEEFRARTEAGWLELQTAHARLGFGRMDRNWGPPGLDGFTRSDYAYSWDELSYRVGADGIFLTGTFASLPDGNADGDTARYLAVHRLEVRPSDRLALAVSEAALHGGPDRSLEFAFVNPVGIWHLEQGEDREANFVGQADLWWRPVDGLVLQGSLLADATNSPETGGTSCCQMGGTVAVGLPGLVGAWSLRLEATSVQSLAYRTGLPWEEWSVNGLGMGWDEADLHHVALEAEWLGRPGLVVRPRLDLQARGERTDFTGDLRPASTAGFPQVLVGEAELTVRPSVSGRWRPAAGEGWGLELRWDVGIDLIRDHRHRPGDDREALVGVLQATLETPRLLVPLD